MSMNQSSPQHAGDKYTSFLHTLEVIYREEGWRGFYTGYKINVKAIPIFHSLFFPLYETLKHKCLQWGFSKWQEYFFSSVFAGAVCNLITNPIWVVRTRIMVQYLHPEEYHYPNTGQILPIIRQMIAQEGISSLWRGLSASVMGISNAVIYFLMYESIKDQLKDHHLFFNSYYVALSSIASKFVASSITYPLVVIRTVLHDHRTEEKMSVLRIMRYIYTEKGLNGFYGGLKPDLIRLLPSNAIVFVVYEYLKRIL